jgi:outer membrane protein assembly factor BamE (lipoprotein component of BamABCDE complex)
MDKFLASPIWKRANMPIFRIIFYMVAWILLMNCHKMPLYQNQKNLMQLKKGLVKEEVINVMGQPNFHEAYESLYGNTFIILYYHTHRNRFDGKITKDECTPVVIKNDKLVGWGDDFYEWLNRREKKINHK